MEERNKIFLTSHGIVSQQAQVQGKKMDGGKKGKKERKSKYSNKIDDQIRRVCFLLTS